MALETKLIEKDYYKYQCENFKIITDMYLCGPARNVIVNKTDPLVEKAKLYGNKITKYGNTDKVVLLRGCYPSGFLGRLEQAFHKFRPLDPNTTLHVCAGAVPKTFGKTLDISPLFNPDYCCNAEDMNEIDDETFLWSISDTPYNDDASSKYYGKPLVNKSKVLREMTRVTKSGGFVGILDQIFPQGPPHSLKCIARIGVTSVPNLDIRALTIFNKTT